MADFDPYYRWLGIPPEEQPAHHYRLLGLTLFESDRAVIESRSLDQIDRVRNLQLVEDPEEVGSVLGALALARSCLLDADQKAAYDAELYEKLASSPPPLRESVEEDLFDFVRGNETDRLKAAPPSQQGAYLKPAAIALGAVGAIALLLVFLLTRGQGPSAEKLPLTPAQLAVGDPIENSIGMVMVPIPAGEFLMGSPDSETSRTDNETQHRVKLTNSFQLGRTEVTQGQWQAVMGTTPWKGKEYVNEGDDYPATYVS